MLDDEITIEEYLATPLQRLWWRIANAATLILNEVGAYLRKED
jgi:hypothetical protein